MPWRNNMENDEITVLHISDIHIGADIVGTPYKHLYWKDQSGNGINQTNQDDLEDRKSYIPELIKKGKEQYLPDKDIDLIVLTGDLVLTGARKEEHDKAFKTIKEIIDELSFGKDNLFIVPGNHEVDRNSSKKYSCNNYYEVYNKFFDDTKKMIVEEAI